MIYCIFLSRTDKNVIKMKWNESGFKPPLCTYRLNWARRTSWGWWDDWDDTVLQTQDSKFKPWRSEAEHATSRSRRLPTILTFTRGWRRNIFSCFHTAETGNRTPDSGVKVSGANHYPRAPAHKNVIKYSVLFVRKSKPITIINFVTWFMPNLSVILLAHFNSTLKIINNGFISYKFRFKEDLLVDKKY